MEKKFTKITYTQEEALKILREEEAYRRREAKKRREEILALLTAQKADWELDHKGKLWGEDSLTDLAAKAYGGEGADYTDVEAEICSNEKKDDPSSIVFRYPTQMQWLLLQEAWDTVEEVVLSRWGNAGKDLLELWLDAPVATVCLENNLPAIPTLMQIKEMVFALREAQGKSRYFPFPEEEKEIREKRKGIKCATSIQRMLEGKSNPADPGNRIYLTSEEKTLTCPEIVELAKSRYGVAISNATATRAKKTGWFMRPRYEHGGQGRKVFISPEDIKLSSTKVVRKYGISQRTALKAQKEGFFYITNQNRDKVKVLDLENPVVRKETREKLAERDGYKILESGEKSVHCFLCGQDGLLLKKAVIGHLLPLNQGSGDLLENLCLAHGACSKERDSNLFQEALKKLQKKIAAQKSKETLPAIITEVGGKQIKEFTISEMVNFLGFSSFKAGKIIKRGFISTKTYSKAKQQELLGRLKKLEGKDLPPKKLPDEIKEVNGRALKELSVEEIIELLGYKRSAAYDVKKRGIILTKHFSEKKRDDLARHLACGFENFINP